MTSNASSATVMATTIPVVPAKTIPNGLIALAPATAVLTNAEVAALFHSQIIIVPNSNTAANDSNIPVKTSTFNILSFHFSNVSSLIYPRSLIALSDFLTPPVI